MQRNFYNNDIQKFELSLQEENWAYLYAFSPNSNKKYSDFITQFLRIFNNNFPKKEMVEKRKLPLKKNEWMTEGLRISSIRKRSCIS